MAKIPEPYSTKLLRLLWQASGRRHGVDAMLSRRLKYRQSLPVLDPPAAIPRYHETEVRIARSPAGGWSTPLADVFTLLKAALGFESRRILELGSYRGETARLLAENTGPDTRICAVDIDPRHGAAYEGLPCAAKISKVTGAIAPGLFTPGDRFDLIFVDALHDYESVLHDTETAFGLLSETGVILWHDCRVGNYFGGGDNVADALRTFSDRQPIATLSKTTLAMHSRYPGWETARLARQTEQPSAVDNIWLDQGTRG